MKWNMADSIIIQKGLIMVKKLLSAVVLGFLLSNVAQAAQFGVVDIQRVILSVEEGKSARSDLEKEIKEKEKSFMTQKKELDDMNQQWKSQSALMSEQARRDKQTEFQEKFMALRNEEMQFQQGLKKREGEATQAIAIKVAKMVTEMAQQRKLEIVFEANSSGLIYVKDPVDLTADVIKNYDSKNKNISKK